MIIIEGNLNSQKIEGKICQELISFNDKFYYENSHVSYNNDFYKLKLSSL